MESAETLGWIFWLSEETKTILKSVVTKKLNTMQGLDSEIAELPFRETTG